MARNQKLMLATIAPGALLVAFLAGARTARADRNVAATTPVAVPAMPVSYSGFAPGAGDVFQVPAGRQDLPDGPPTVSFKGRDIPSSFHEIVNPKHTVLVVHEMLNTFISEGGAYDKAGRRYDLGRMARIVPPIQKLLATARAKNVRVAYLRYTSHGDGSAASEVQVRNSIARTGQPPASPGDAGTVDGSWGWQNIDAVKPEPGDWILRKYRPNGFNGTPLEMLLRWNGIRTFIIVGIGGEVGLLPTVETADELGYFTIVPTDCVLSSNASRQEALMPFLADHAMMKTSADLLDSWTKR